MSFERPDGSVCFVPTAWTDAAPPDPYVGLGRKRSRFRVENLLRLAELIEERRGA